MTIKNTNFTTEDIVATLKSVGCDAPADVFASELLGVSLDTLYEEVGERDVEEYIDDDFDIK